MRLPFLTGEETDAQGRASDSPKVALQTSSRVEARIQPPPALGTSPLTPDKASCSLGAGAVCMWGGVISSQAGPCLLSQMSGSCEPNGELAWTPQSGARHPMSSLLLSLSGTHFLPLYSVGQGAHLLPSYSEKLSLLSLEGAVEQRPLLRAGSSLPLVLGALATCRRPAWASATP